MSGVQELKTVRKKIAQCEDWLANARADMAYARVAECPMRQENAAQQLWRAETHLTRWQRAYALLSGSDYDAD